MLGSLAPDRELAGAEYELLRRKLVRFFECRGCLSPEDSADETINRVARKIAEGEALQNPSGYFYGVARKVLLEELRRQAHEQRLEAPSPVRAGDLGCDPDRLNCLRRCLKQLPPESLELILAYYQGEQRVKIENRLKLAERLGAPVNALRIRACRVRQSIRACVEDCLCGRN